MDKYEELVDQINFEFDCEREKIEEELGIYIPKDMTLVDFIGSDIGKKLNVFDRGLIFGYLSIKSKVDMLNGEST